MQKLVVLTDHAFSRCAQRNLSIDDVCYAIEHGRCVYRAGVKAYFLGAKDIPQMTSASSVTSNLSDCWY